MIVVPDGGARDALDDLLAELTGWAHLYVEDVVLGPDTTRDDLTEASWPDYQPLRVTGWAPSVALDGLAVSEADLLLWIRGPGGDPAQVYGYFVSDLKDGPLVWVERRPQGPIAMSADTDQVLLLPRLTLR
jgi:hypothetical protein